MSVHGFLRTTGIFLQVPDPRPGRGQNPSATCGFLRPYEVVIAVDSSCSERDRLMKRYLSAVSAFGVVANDARPDSEALRKLTQRTSESWQTALNAVWEHERKHGCGIASGREAPLRFRG